MKLFESLKEKFKGMDLTEEQVESLIKFAKSEVPKDFIPKDKYNQKISELDEVNSTLEQTNEKIKELNNSSENAEEYKKKLQAVNDELDNVKKNTELKMSKLQKESIMKEALIKKGADPDNLDLLMYELEAKYDDMELKDNDIANKDDFINPIAEKRSKLFLKSKIDTPNPKDGDGISDTEFKDIDSAMGL